MTAKSPTLPNHHAAPMHKLPAAVRAAGVVVALTAALAILAIAFALPAAKSRPHDVPIGAAGPASSQVAGQLEQNAPGGFKVTAYATKRHCAPRSVIERSTAACHLDPTGPRC